MNFSAQQLSSGKWGIYHGTCLLATTASKDTCETVLLNLAKGRDALASSIKPLPQGPSLRMSARHEASPTDQPAGSRKLTRSSKAKRKTDRPDIVSVETQKRHTVASEEAAAACRLEFPTVSRA
ncbi:MAG: hypothetical protein WBB01_01755 [Phormidesmis sp.]